VKPTRYPAITTGEIAWHALPVRTVASLYVTDPRQGLTDAEAASRRSILHANTVRAPRPTWRLMARQAHGFLMALLAILAVATAFLRLWIDSAVILAVLALNVGFAVILKLEANRARAALRNQKAWTARALRAGREVTVPASELVPGDVILVEDGNIVPADARLFVAEALSCCEAPLTNHSAPNEKTAAPVASNVPLHQRNDMIYMGSRIESGRGRAIVVATGAEAAIGSRARLEELHSSSKLLKHLARTSRPRS
jgi:Ca2+-transporting ATPase